MRSFFHAAHQYIKRSPIVKLGIKLILTFAALWLVFHEIDFERLDVIFAHQDLSLMVLPVVLLSLQAVLGAVRWRVILLFLADVKKDLFTLGYALRIGYIGMFFNSCLPGGTVGGDAVRVWMMRSRELPLSLSIHSVIIDRIVALAALALMVVACMPMLGQIHGFNGFLLAPFLLLLALAGLWLLFNIERFLGRFSTMHIVHQLIYFISNVRLLVSSLPTTLLVLFYAIAGHVLYCIAMSYVAQSLSIELSFTNSLILIPPVVLVATLPISIGGWGIRELASIAMLGMIGIPQEEALILSLEAGVLSIVVGLPGGLLWLLHKRSQPQKANEA